ncbi:MAG: GNAT family N-acetyltransferase [Acidobacteria bacterium]|nr:MAG: GNAT family N-acetyltransferase [Acidobacteriota bacterium]
MVARTIVRSMNVTERARRQRVRLSTVEALSARRDEWNALVGRSHTQTVFQTYEWHASWWKTLGSGRQPLVLLVEEGRELRGIAPLMWSERRLWGRQRKIIEFIGAGSSDYCDFIVDRDHPEALPLLVQWLSEHAGEWDVLHLSDIPNTTPTLSLLPRLFCSYGYLTDVRKLYEAPTRLLGDPVADKQCVKKKSLRRHYNYFRRRGRLDVKHCRTEEEICQYLDLFFQQHIERRALTDVPSQFLNERQRAFYRTLVRELAPTGWLLFSVVLFNDIPLAFHFGFEFGDRLVWYKPTFNVRYAKHSPGEVLIKYLLEYAIERQMAEFDFTIGEESFKYRFANHVRYNYAIHVFGHRLLCWRHRLWMSTKARVKRFPRLARWGRRVIQHMRRFDGDD